MADQLAFYRQIVEKMTEGVMALDSGGMVTLFNDAAAKILGMETGSVRDRSFSRVFMMELEGNDRFSQTILDAVYEPSKGIRETIEYTRPNGDKRVIAMSTAYLKKSGEGENDGIVVVLNDLTEITRSREKLALAHKELEAKQRELQEAYVIIERSNSGMKRKLTNRRMVRWAMAALAVAAVLGGTAAFFSGVGLSGDQMVKAFKKTRPAGQKKAAEPRESFRALEIKTRSVTDWLRLKGVIQPRQWIDVHAPMDAEVKAIHFTYGSPVEKGDLLVELNTFALNSKLREARSAYYKAKEEMEKMKNWSNGIEVTRARREAAKAREELKRAEREQEYNRMLYEKGIISGQELDRGKVAVENSRQSLLASREVLKNTLAQGGMVQVRIAELALENARDNLAAVEASLSAARILSPANGIVFTSRRSDARGNEAVRLGLGSRVKQNSLMFTIADMHGVTVESEVDEQDLNLLSLGQPVRISVKSLENEMLVGKIDFLAGRGAKGLGGGSKFKVRALATGLPEQLRGTVRIGMSAEARVRVYDNPKAVIIPFEAIVLKEQTPMVRVEGENGEVNRRPVTVRNTQVDGVEVSGGLKAGDRILIPVYEGRKDA